jgi:cbb3-type cytochrome oxidase maturation protein
MNVILLLMAASLVVAVGFLALFVWAVRRGQYDDTTTPAMRMLTDDERTPGKNAKGMRTP